MLAAPAGGYRWSSTSRRTQLIQAPPARVMAAFFNDADLKNWWQVTRVFTVPRPLGMYAIEWAVDGVQR